MDVSAIIEYLATTDGLPRAALKLAKANRAELAPRLVREVERRLALKPADRGRPRQLFFIFHLLADWGRDVDLSPGC